MPEHELADRIVTEAQEVSLTKVMNENDIDLVYFSHPHKEFVPGGKTVNSIYMCWKGYGCRF